MFKFIKKLFKKKEPEEDPNIIIEEEEKAKQEIIYTIDKHREEGSKINNRAIKKEPKKALRNNIVKESNPLIL